MQFLSRVCFIPVPTKRTGPDLRTLQGKDGSHLVSPADLRLGIQNEPAIRDLAVGRNMCRVSVP